MNAAAEGEADGDVVSARLDPARGKDELGPCGRQLLLTRKLRYLPSASSTVCYDVLIPFRKELIDHPTLPKHVQTSGEAFHA